MAVSTKLAISIPTFNHPNLIETGILAILPELETYSIPLYISDNSTNFETEAVVAKLREKYPYIYYRKNTHNLGYDDNFLLALTWPDTDFVWPLGDGLIIQPGGISYVMTSLNLETDLFIVNDRSVDQTPYAVLKQDVKEFLLRKTWYITLLGATVYGRKPRAVVVASDQKMLWKNFLHLGLILFFCLTQPVTLYWSGRPILSANPQKNGSGWTGIPFDVFVGNWSNLISCFSSFFSSQEIFQIIRSHAVNTRIFGFREIVKFRANGVLDFLIYQKHRENMKMAIPIPIWSVFLIARLPKGVCKFMLFLI